MSNDLISRQAALKALEFTWAGKAAFDAIKELPSAEPEIIRCKDCRHSVQYNKRWVKPTEPDKWWCYVWEDGMDDGDFCSRGERREDE